MAFPYNDWLEFYGKTQKEVKDKLDAYKKQYYLSSDISDDKITLEHWFYNWLFEYRIKDLKPKSFERYESIYHNYIKDTDLGNVKLKDLRVSHIQKYYNRLLDSNKSIPTIRQINTKLKTCLSEAEKQGLIQRNYCTMVNIPVEKTVQVLMGHYDISITLNIYSSYGRQESWSCRKVG